MKTKKRKVVDVLTGLELRGVFTKYRDGYVRYRFRSAGRLIELEARIRSVSFDGACLRVLCYPSSEVESFFRTNGFPFVLLGETPLFVFKEEVFGGVKRGIPLILYARDNRTKVLSLLLEKHLGVRTTRLALRASGRAVAVHGPAC